MAKVDMKQAFVDWFVAEEVRLWGKETIQGYVDDGSIAKLAEQAWDQASKGRVEAKATVVGSVCNIVVNGCPDDFAVKLAESFTEATEAPRPSEALYMFAAWVTSMAPPRTTENCAEWAQLVGEFCKFNNLEDPRNGYPGLEHPPNS